MADQLTNASIGTIPVTQGSKIVLETAHTYIPHDIELTMAVETANPQFDGGELTGESTAEFTNITTSNTNNGIKVQTKYAITRANVLYNGLVAGWVAKDDNTIALTGDSVTSTNGTEYYISGLTVPVDIPFTITTNADNTLDTNSDLIINHGAFRKAAIANNGVVAVNSGAANSGILQVSAYASGSDELPEAAQTVVNNGVWVTNTINPSTTTLGPYYGKVSINAVTTNNLTASNIKHEVSVTVDGGNNTLYTVQGSFTSDGTINAAKVLYGEVAYSQGNRIVGEMPNNGVLGDTITTQNGTYTIPAGYTTGGTVTATFPVSSVLQPDSTKDSTTKVVTRANASWTTGYITNGVMNAATFANTATSGIDYIDLSDAIDSNENRIVPEIPSGGDIFINKGYIDNVKISLSRLIPDTGAVSGLAGEYILAGHSAFDNAGNLIVGTITSKTAHTYYPDLSDQTISATQYLSGDQTFKAVQLTNISAANIKYNVTVEVGDSDDSDRVASVTGTFTATPDGKNALTATALRSGYAGFINGEQINGSMPDINVTTAIAKTALNTYFDEGTSSNNSISLMPTYTNNTAGYLAQHTSAQNGTVEYYKIKTATFVGDGGNVTLVADTTSNSIYQSSENTGNVSVDSSAPAISSQYMYIKVIGSGTAKGATAGWIEANGATTTGSSTKYIKILKYDGSYTVT